MHAISAILIAIWVGHESNAEDSQENLIVWIPKEDRPQRFGKCLLCGSSHANSGADCGIRLSLSPVSRKASGSTIEPATAVGPTHRSVAGKVHQPNSTRA